MDRSTRFHIPSFPTFQTFLRPGWGCAQVVDGLFMRLSSRPNGSWTLRLAALTPRCAAKPYWWQYGQAAHTATHRVNVRMNRFSPTYQAHSSTYRHNKTHPTRSHYPLPKSQKDPSLVTLSRTRPGPQAVTNRITRGSSCRSRWRPARRGSPRTRSRHRSRPRSSSSSPWPQPSARR